MKNAKFLLSTVAIVFFVMCGPSSENKQAESGIDQSMGIKWADYGSGLKQSAENDKYILAYFWRDG